MSTVNEEHGALKTTPNWLLMLLFEDTVKLTVPPAVTVWDSGVTFKLMGFVTTTVPVLEAVTAIVTELPPFFLIVADEGSAESLGQPGPPPVIGGPGGSSAESLAQSKMLLCKPPPGTIVYD
jgi:hypothetical protein